VLRVMLQIQALQQVPVLEPLASLHFVTAPLEELLQVNYLPVRKRLLLQSSCKQQWDLTLCLR